MVRQRRSRNSLRANQVEASECIFRDPGVMLWIDMGGGKTGAVLTAVVDLLDMQIVSHVLVVAPLLVAEETWPEEIDTWQHTQHLTYEVLTGDAERRENRARFLPDVTLINQENIPWLIDFWGDDWPYDMLVIDEISRFKNPKKKTDPTPKQVKTVTDSVVNSLPRNTQPVDLEIAVKKALSQLRGSDTRFGALCKILKKLKRRVGMTGTPAPNGLIDLWSQFFIIDQGKRLGHNITAYKTRWFERSKDGFGVVPKHFAIEQIPAVVSDITVTHQVDLGLDEPVYNKRWVNLPDKVYKKYKEFEREMSIEFEGEEKIEAVNNGVLTMKLLQAANGALYREDKSFIQLHDLKLDALESIIEEAAGKPVLVAYSFQFDLEKLKKRFPKGEVVGEAKDVQKRWNAGKIPLLFAHPASAGHGLNLQFGSNICVWYGLTWSLELYQQLNKRLHRPGQKETVIIHHILCRKTVDERVMKVLPEKDATQNELIEATRMHAKAA